MNPPFKAGQLARGELLLTLIRKKECADCKAEIEGPPSMRRCAGCQKVHKKAVRKVYWRKVGKFLRHKAKSKGSAA